jgi:hypothetical protein
LVWVAIFTFIKNEVVVGYSNALVVVVFVLLQESIRLIIRLDHVIDVIDGVCVYCWSRMD